MTFENSPYKLQDWNFPPLGDWAYAPVQLTDFLFLDISYEDKWEIVGESRYHENIDRVYKRYLEEGSLPNTLVAAFIHEPRNPFDRFAVRIDLICTTDDADALIATAGYLPKHAAYEYHKAVKRIAEQGKLPITSVEVFGGTVDKPNYGVWLGHGDAGKPSDEEEIED